MHSLLKFRYFLLFLCCLNCKEAPKSNSPEVEDSSSESVKESSNNGNKTILFFGDSLTAGYGIELEEAFPALIQQRLDSMAMDYTVINSGLSGETTSGGLNRINWVLNQKSRCVCTGTWSQ